MAGETIKRWIWRESTENDGDLETWTNAPFGRERVLTEDDARRDL